MAEESKILESLVRRQIRFNAAIKKESSTVRNTEPLELPLPELKPEITEKEESSITEESQ